MAVSKQKRVTVLMGDLVRSEHTFTPAKLHKLFNEAVNKQNSKHKEELISPLTITLGDEFQGIVVSLEYAAKIARNLRMDLLAHSIDCRFVIGQAKIDTPLNYDKAWNMMGPGLSRAREKLNEKKSGIFYRFSVAEAPITEVLLDALGAGISAIEDEWTDQQHQDISALLNGETPAQIARRRDVSVHNIYKVRSSGNFDTYNMQWKAIEKALNAIDNQARLG